MSKEPSKTPVVKSNKLENIARLSQKLKGGLDNKLDLNFSLRERINHKFIENLSKYLS